jgi:glucose-1-phosphate thymidylyltransferase
MVAARKGILLAGGTGTRLYPLTRAVSKQLLPVYDKPMVYYPLTTLMLSGIRDILVITTPEEQSRFRNLLGDGTRWGLSLSYVAQARPEGIAQAFILGREFISGAPSALVLGDNIFYGHGLPAMASRAAQRPSGATVFGYWVKNPSAYGVAEFDANGVVVGLEEKPAKPKSHYAVTGLYFYDGTAPDRAAALKPSARGELEITDLNRTYLEQGELGVELLGRGFAWLDTGTHEALLQASNFIQTIEARQGLKVGCPEEIAFSKGWIGKDEVLRQASELGKTEYADYLRQLVEG